MVVGRRMQGVPEHEALSDIGGFACANDVGLHDFRHADRGSMLRVKGQDGFLPLGPELVPASEFDPTSFSLRTYLNGEVVQETTAADLLVPGRLRARRRVPADHAGARRRGAHGDAGELAADGAGRRGGGRDRRPRPPLEHRRRVDVELAGPGAFPSVTADTSTSRSLSPRTRRSAGGESRRRVIRLRASTTSASPWTTSTRRGRAGRASSGCSTGAAAPAGRCLRARTSRTRSSWSRTSPVTCTPRSSSRRDCRLEEAAAALEAAGVGAVELDGSLHLADPDGSGIELVPPRERERVGRARAPLEGVRPGAPRKLGHVNFLTADLAAGGFYTDALGMRLTDWLGDAGRVAPVNTDHHVMALVDKGVAHFHHLAFDVVDIGQMRVALDHLGRHGRWLGWGPARHGVGGNIASYVRIVEEAVLRRAVLRHGAAAGRARAARLDG